MASRYCIATLVLLFLHISSVVPIKWCGNSEMIMWGQHCYFFQFGYDYNWIEVKARCEAIGAEFASIHSQEEQDYISGVMLAAGAAYYWIGMRKDSDASGNKENYKWVDGTEVDYSHWGPRAPTGIRSCVTVSVKYFYNDWSDTKCTFDYPYVCKTPIVHDWQQYKGNEYYISTLPDEIESTWYEAREFCMQQGGDVASILDEEEVIQAATWATQTSYQGQLWIGLNKLAEARKEWGWSDGSSYSSMWNNWQPLFPKKDTYGHLCGYQNSNDVNGTWRNGHCDTKKGFLCKRPITSSPTPKTTIPTQPVGGYCPADYYGSGNKCFKVVLPGHFGEGSLTFDQATVICKQEPGIRPSLASIENEVDQAFINAHLTSVKIGVWIGLYREKPGSTWLWVDSSPYQYDNWSPKKPTSGNGNCTEVWMLPGSIGEWNNINCSKKRGYICQTYKNQNNIIPTSAVPNVNFTCPAGFTPYWYGCYKYQPTAWSWDTASFMCKRLDPSATLVGIHAEAENAAIQTLSLTHDTGIWLGFRDNRTNGEDGEYKWEDGWHVLWTNWADGQPVKEYQGGCVRMFSDGRWLDDVCSKQYPSVCKISQVPALTTPATLPGTCPTAEGWFEYGEHCYLIITDTHSSWEGAKEKCQDKGFLSTLVSIHSHLEHKMLLDMLNLTGYGNRNVWIGLHRSAPDRTRIRWTDGSALQYEAWAPAEPNGEHSREDCVRIWNEEWPGKWSDHACSDDLGYVCKAPKTPHVTPSTAAHCDPGWVYSSVTGHCYLFKPDESLTHDDSFKKCREVAGADLASVHGAFEMGFIRFGMKNASLLPPDLMDTHYWFGLAINKTADDTYAYYWTDDTVRDYDHWHDHQPNNPYRYPCVYVDMVTGQWLTARCEQRLSYVCKMPSILNRPTGDIPGGGAGAGMMATGHMFIIVFSALLGLIFSC